MEFDKDLTARQEARVLLRQAEQAQKKLADFLFHAFMARKTKRFIYFFSMIKRMLSDVTNYLKVQ